MVIQLPMLAKGLVFRLGLGSIFRLKSQIFCEPAIFISAKLRQNTPKLVHNMCFSLTSIMINLYQDNCGKTLDQSYSFFNLILLNVCNMRHVPSPHYQIKVILSLLKHRLVTKNILAFLHFFLWSVGNEDGLIHFS